MTMYESGYNLGDYADYSNMVCQGGTVVRVEDDKAFVKIDRDKGCESCSAKGNCGVMFSSEALVEVRNEIGVTVGQRVEIGVRPAAVLTASILLFIVPASGLILGIIAGYLLAELFGWPWQQWVGFGFGALGFAAAVLAIKLLSPRLHESGKYEPVITRILT